MTDTLYVHSIESLGALDGPGLRTVIFLSGCPLRCSYCHNPDTWQLASGQSITLEDLFNRIMKFKPYYKNKGGVTFSGGDPLLQAKNLTILAKQLKQEGIHIALDTSGALWNDDIEALIDLTDLVLLDVKHTNSDAYNNLTSGALEDNQYFLKQLIDHKKPYWIRQVIIPSINDTANQLRVLHHSTLSNYREKLELLPFHKKALHKWTSLGLTCPFENLEEMSQNKLENLIKATELPFNTFSI